MIFEMRTIYMRLNKLLTAFLCAAAYVFSINSAAAVPTIHTSAASFLAAIGGTADISENFNSTTTDISFRNTTAPNNGFSLSSVGNEHAGFNIVDASPFNDGTFSLGDGTFVAFFVQNSGGAVTTAAIEFDQAVIGFGANFRSLENAVLSINGVALSHASTSGSEFFGFTVDPTDAFTRIDITGAGDRFSMDDVLIAFAPTVPEPGALALLGLGLIGLGVARRRQKAA